MSARSASQGVPLIRMKDVTKVYGRSGVEVRAADGVSLDIERGEFLLVVGPSGAGKTTLLNLLGGMERPTSGQILFYGGSPVGNPDESPTGSSTKGPESPATGSGSDLDSIAAYDLAQLDERGLTRYRRHEVGFVFQFYNLIASLTAQENVELASEMSEDPLPARDMLAQVGLADRADSFPAELSGGEQQRVAIARALAKNPRLILADEPTGALDFKTGRAVLDLLQRVCTTSGKTLVLITHNLAFAPIANRIAHVSGGRIEHIDRNETPGSALDLTW